MERLIVMHPGEDGYWVAECPSLPGCISQGTTRDEAVENIKEAIAAYIESLVEHGDPVPIDDYDTVMVMV